MYTREIQAPRDTPIENGLPVQGTWDKAFKNVNLRDIRKPYSQSLLNWTRESRIKEWQSFEVQNDQYFFTAHIANFKLYCLAQLHLFNKSTAETYEFRKIIPGDCWRMPCSLANSSVTSRLTNFFFRIHNWLDADIINLEIDLKKHKELSAFTVYLGFDMKKQLVCPMAVSLGFTETRSMYAFKATAPVWGDIVLDGMRINLDPAKTTGIFCDYKGYYPYRMHSIICGAMGFTNDNYRYGFHLSESQVKNSNRNNENALWLNNSLCPLPPVRITMPNGAESDWVIQDLEGMVDLIFTPVDHSKYETNRLITSAEYHASIGRFNGMLLDSSEKQIQVRDMWGMGEKIYLRV